MISCTASFAPYLCINFPRRTGGTALSFSATSAQDGRSKTPSMLDSAVIFTRVNEFDLVEVSRWPGA